MNKDWKKILNKGVTFYDEVIESLNLRLEMVKIGFSGNNSFILNISARVNILIYFVPETSEL